MNFPDHFEGSYPSRYTDSSTTPDQVKRPGREPVFFINGVRIEVISRDSDRLNLELKPYLTCSQYKTILILHEKAIQDKEDKRMSRVVRKVMTRFLKANLAQALGVLQPETKAGGEV